MKEDPVPHFKTIEQNSWALTYLYPDFFGHGRLPVSTGFSTSTTTLEFDRVFNVDVEGKFLAYFSPVTETFASYTNGDIFKDLEAGDINQYIVYADNGKESINVTNNILNNTSSWNYAHGPSTKLNSFFKQLRVVGAYIELSVKDVSDNYKGIVEACEYFEIAGNGISSEEINITKLLSYPRHQAQKPNESLKMIYRKNNSKLDDFGPYEPFTTLPFFLFYGHDLSPTATVTVKYKIHIEGVVLPHVSHFATTKSLYGQNPYAWQKDLTRKKQTTQEESRDRENLQKAKDEQSAYFPRNFPTDGTWVIDDVDEDTDSGGIFRGTDDGSDDTPGADKVEVGLGKRGKHDDAKTEANTKPSSRAQSVRPKEFTPPFSPAPEKVKNTHTLNSNSSLGYVHSKIHSNKNKVYLLESVIDTLNAMLEKRKISDPDIGEHARSLPIEQQNDLIDYIAKKSKNVYKKIEGDEVTVKILERLDQSTIARMYVYQKAGKDFPKDIKSLLEKKHRDHKTIQRIYKDHDITGQAASLIKMSPNPDLLITEPRYDYAYTGVGTRT